MITLKKYNSTTSSWEEESPKVSVGTIVASGTPSSSTFLRGDGSWATPTGGSGDVVGPASSVNARIATFNGTTGKLIQDSGFTTANIAGNTSSTFWNPQNLSIPMFSNAVGWYTTTTIPGLVYTQVLSSNAETTNSVTTIAALSITNVPPGNYRIGFIGLIDKSAGTSSFSVTGGIGTNDGTNVSGLASSLSKRDLATGVTLAQSQIGTGGPSIQMSFTTSSTTQILNHIVTIDGIIKINGTTNKTVSFYLRQALNTSNTTWGGRLQAGAVLTLQKI
jgi:hypothetical protein